METDHGYAEMESNNEFKIVLLDAIAGKNKDEYFILGSRDNSSNSEEVDGIVISVRSLPLKLEWNMIFSIEAWCLAMMRFNSESYLICTSNGDLVRVENATRKTIQSGINGPIYSVWGNSDTDCWLTHGAGISHWDGNIVSKHYTSGMMFASHGVDDKFAVAVGMDGVIFYFNGNTWRKVDSVPVNTHLLSVFCISRDEIYVGGWEGKMYRWDGRDRWTKIVLTDTGTEISESIHYIIQYKGEIYASAARAGLFKINGEQGVKLHSDYSSRLAVIDDKLISLGLELISEYNGESWKQVSIIIP